MSMDIQQHTISRNSQIAIEKMEQHQKLAKTQSEANAEVSTQATSSVLHLTSLLKGRAEIAALQLSSSNIINDTSSLQVSESGVRQIHAILQQLSELGGKVSGVADMADLTRIQQQAQRLGHRIAQIVNASMNYTSGMQLPASASDNAEAALSERPAGELFTMLVSQELSENLAEVDFDTPENAAASVDVLHALAGRMLAYADQMAELSSDAEQGLQNQQQNQISSDQAQKMAANVQKSIFNRPDMASLAQLNAMHGHRVQAI